MAGTRDAAEVLREIERDLRTDEEIWKRIDRDLATLGGRPRRRTSLIVASVIVLIALLAGAFALGWNLAPAPAPTAKAAVAQPFTSSGLWAKRDGFMARYGDITEEHPVVPATPTIPSSSLASKREGFEARYGTSESAAAPASMMMTGAAFETWRATMIDQHGH